MRFVHCVAHVLKWFSQERNETPNRPTDVHLEGLSVSRTPLGTSLAPEVDLPLVRVRATESWSKKGQLLRTG
jgi:hypothetical protein